MLRQAAIAGARAACAAFGLTPKAASLVTPPDGAVRGGPPDTGRRQRSVIDRAFQANTDIGATSSMPEPGATPS